MITSIRLKDFKIFRNQSFEFRNLNLLTGLNGMGKSTVIQALLLLREASFDRKIKEGLNLSNNELYNVGKVEDLRNEFAEKPYTIDIELGENEYKNLFVYDAESNGKPKFLKLKNAEIKKLEDAALFSESNFVYLQAERITPKDSYDKAGGLETKNKFRNDGEYAIDFFHQNKETFIIPDYLCRTEIKTLEAQVNAWLNLFSPTVEIHTQDIGNKIHLDYSFNNSAKRHDPINVGFGVTYTLPIIIALLTAKPGDLLIIENPEAHLHPRGQSKIAELMCLVAQSGVQIFCETHSDHIFDSIRVSTKEKIIKNDLLKIYYFERVSPSWQSEVHSVSISDRGRITNKIPDGFYDQYVINLDKLL